MRIYTASPKAFFPRGVSPDSFFSRDMGLTCLALRAAGADSRVVLLDGPAAQAHPDVLRASMAELQSAGWWSRLAPDAVVLCSWAAPRYTPVAQAIKAAGARLIVRCDSGEPFSQWQKTPREAFRTHVLAARYAGRPVWRALGFALLKTPLFYVPAIYDRRVAEHLAMAHAVFIESPEAARLLREFLTRYGHPEAAARVRYVPHPVRTPAPAPDAPRARRVVAVGRWNHYQKNAPLLLRVLGRALAAETGYDAHIFGAGEADLRRGIRRLPDAVRARVVVRGVCAHETLAGEYGRCRILFAPSRSESFNLAAAEALSSGCSVVGAAHLLAFRHFVSRQSGTLASAYTARALAGALSAEMQAWDTGRRSAAGIRAAWQTEFAPAAIARAVLEAVPSAGPKP